MDSSWWLQWGNTSMVIDPWLVGSEVDGFKWLNEQWHETPPIPIVEIPSYQNIVISQPYSDHCHNNTLKQLQAEVPIYAVPPAKKRLMREMANRQIFSIGERETDWTSIGELKVARLTPDKLLDPIYHALVMARANEAIVYAPHGFKLTDHQKNLIGDLKVKLLITSFAYFKIPVLLGGLVNPGTAGALALMKQVQPEKVLNTHDENKPGKGLVLRLAKRVYPDMKKEAMNNTRVKALEDYSLINI
jgi:hypothetical protein